MRVRIQYKSHRHLLSGIQSIKNSREEQQMDKFFQATSVMRGRDTGCVVCNISFSDITYLGAFWRDYSNGTLQEALRGVFLTGVFRFSITVTYIITLRHINNVSAQLAAVDFLGLWAKQ